MSLLDGIRNKVANAKFEFSKHATDRILSRNILVQEVREAIGSGEIIEDYPDDKYDPSCLILGFTRARRPLHVQCSHPSRPLIKIITVYEPDPVSREENIVEKRVTYTLEMNGRLFVVENVPARVDLETGEQFFSPETVERLQEIIRGQEKPIRFLETPVFDYAA